ncbi:Cellulose synthase-like protein H1 [Morus notabilis]|uniref:Cellulose synthase-like protein H1 n=1 Tax=Morus notabilis TaxID=981085 RepID=W9QT42_9ROSA|nr:Cellulose synthase-like protein H1 [Morus notabilis]
MRVLVRLRIHSPSQHQMDSCRFQNIPTNPLAKELPAVDIFVTTADTVLEPPIMTVNTVLSAMAVDYPGHKLACYVSDDGCSPIILYSLIEAAKFGHLWIPFCKKYDVQVRAPFRYFSGDVVFPPSSDDDNKSSGFHLEWRRMKDEYEKVRQKIEEAANGTVQIECSGEYAAFSTNTNKSDHPSIIKVIWENKEKVPEGMPHLIYVSREKRPHCPHHYKAGAMNVLTRVSGVMTNAPFMLNVDCDMFVNNPKIVLHAMCSFLGLKPQECAFIQFPQAFYNQVKDDPFGTQSVTIGLEMYGRGMAGIQGPFYAGTGCFHRRKLIYGFSLDNQDVQGKEDDEKILKESFGNSMEFINSLTQSLKDDISPIQDVSSAAQVSSQVAHCVYEHGTAWGIKVGWGYGTLTEGVQTGLRIHRKGLKSISCIPDPPGFLGTTPTSGLSLRFFLRYGLSARAWWNNQRMARIHSATSILFGVLSFLFELLGISEVVFEVTKKDQSDNSSDHDQDTNHKDDTSNNNVGRFTFDESPMFIPVTTFLFVHLTALALSLFGQHDEVGLGEFLSSVWTVLCFWPFVRVLFGKGKYGIPSSIVLKSAGFALIFVQLYRMASVG